MSAVGDALYAEYLLRGRGEVTVCLPARAAGDLPLRKKRGAWGVAKRNHERGEKLRARIVATLRFNGAPMTLDDIVKAVGKSKDSIDWALEVLAADRAVIVTRIEGAVGSRRLFVLAP